MSETKQDAQIIPESEMAKGRGTQYAYSTDEEIYSGRYDSPEQAVQVGFEGDYVETVWIGECVDPDPLIHLDADVLLDRILNSEEFCQEYSEGALESTKEQKEDLTLMVRQCFDDWMRKHGIQVGFYSVERVKEWTREQAIKAGLADPIDDDEETKEEVKP